MLARRECCLVDLDRAIGFHPGSPLFEPGPPRAAWSRGGPAGAARLALRMALSFLAGGAWTLISCEADRSPPRASPASGTSAYAASVAMVESALARHPDSPRLLTVLGRVHHRRGRFREALEVYGRASRDPAAEEARLGAGEALLQTGENDAAAASYREVLALPAAASPDGRQRARIGLAQVSYNLGLYGEAAGHLRAAIREGGGGPELFYLLGRSLEAQCRAPRGGPGADAENGSLAAECIQALEACLKQAPGHLEARYLLGGLFKRLGQEDKARLHLEEFRRLKPASPPLEEAETVQAEAVFLARTQVQLAAALIDLGEAEEALALARRAAGTESAAAEACSLEGRALMRLRRHDEALAAYGKALEKDPRQAESLWNSGKILLLKNRMDEAGRFILRATEARGGFAEGWELLAELSQAHGIFPDRAEEFSRKALQLRPSPKNYIALAMVYFNNGQAERSRQALLEGLRKFPGDAELEEGLKVLAAQTQEAR